MMKHLHKIKPTFISIFPLNTNLFEMLSSKLLKNLAYGLVFQHTSRGLDILMKHSSSCLIYYITCGLYIKQIGHLNTHCLTLRTIRTVHKERFKIKESAGLGLLAGSLATCMHGLIKLSRAPSPQCGKMTSC